MLKDVIIKLIELIYPTVDWFTAPSSIFVLNSCNHCVICQFHWDSLSSD